jgi:hypothetical protein
MYRKAVARAIRGDDREHLMDAIYASDLHKLLQKQSGFCTTIYIPTHAVGPNAPDDAVRLKNLVSTAKHKLIDYGRRPSDVRKSLEVVEDLARDAAFWDRRSKSLGIFLSDDTFERFRLGSPVDEAAIVNRRFHIKQLLPSVTADGRFFILAMSQKRVRLLAATPHVCESVTVKGLPINIEKALNLAGADRGQQVHSGIHSRLRKQGAVFHGQGGQPDTAKGELAQYFRQIDAALRPMLQESNCPLLLACVDYEAPIFRDVCTYRHVAEETLAGNFDHAAEHEIHAQALPIAQRIFSRKRDEAVARYRELANTERTSNRIEAILPAVHQGRVETLFVDYGAADLGVYNPATEFISYGGKNGVEAEDLLDRAAVEGLLHHGDVYAVPRLGMPCDSSVAAIFRY